MVPAAQGAASGLRTPFWRGASGLRRRYKPRRTRAPRRTHGTRLRQQTVHPGVRPPRVVPEEDVRDRRRPEQTETISDAKHLIFEGLRRASEEGAEPEVTGSLVDEQFGGDVPAEAKAAGLKLAMPVEKSGE